MKQVSPPSMKEVFSPLPIPYSTLPTLKLEGPPPQDGGFEQGRPVPRAYSLVTDFIFCSG